MHTHAEAAAVRGRGLQRGALQRGQARADLHARVLHARVHLRRRHAHMVKHIDCQAAGAASYLRAGHERALGVQSCELQQFRFAECVRGSSADLLLVPLTCYSELQLNASARLFQQLTTACTHFCCHHLLP